MTVKELYDRLSLTFPASLSCEWDHDGLVVSPDTGRSVQRVLVTLDVTDAAVAHAVKCGADVILSHHPLLFHPLTAVTPEEPVAAKVLTCLTHGISVMCFHTRADAAHGGVSDLMVEKLGLSNIEILGDEKILRAGNLVSPMTSEELANTIKEAFSAPAVVVADTGRPIRWLAVSGGEGKDMVALAKASGCDALLAGRIGYHAMLDGREAGITLFEAGHFYTERPVLELFRELVSAAGIPVETYCEPPLKFY